MTRSTISPSERLDLVCVKGLTIDGDRAAIGGVRNDFATVSNLRTNASHEFSWEAVARIVAKGGAFKS